MATTDMLQTGTTTHVTAMTAINTALSTTMAGRTTAGIIQGIEARCTATNLPGRGMRGDIKSVLMMLTMDDATFYWAEIVDTIKRPDGIIWKRTIMTDH